MDKPILVGFGGSGRRNAHGRNSSDVEIGNSALFQGGVSNGGGGGRSTFCESGGCVLMKGDLYIYSSTGFVSQGGSTHTMCTRMGTRALMWPVVKVPCSISPPVLPMEETHAELACVGYSWQ